MEFIGMKYFGERLNLPPNSRGFTTLKKYIKRPDYIIQRSFDG